MEMTALLFYLFSIITVITAAIVVFSKNIVHSAFSLMFTLLGVAALYVLLYADFIAVTQILVYVGGILILILFGVMLTTQGNTFDFKTVTVNLVPASLLALATAVLLIFAFTTTSWSTTAPIERTDTIYDMGMLLMSDYLLPFIAAGVLLLVAIVAALLMSSRIVQTNPKRG
jgi:NADH-quinone oxidoreductase subunit J